MEASARLNLRALCKLNLRALCNLWFPDLARLGLMPQPGASTGQTSNPRFLSTRTIIFVVDPATLARGDGMQAPPRRGALHRPSAATDRLSVAVLPQWKNGPFVSTRQGKR
jgi:hypothetical protein